MGMSGSGKTFWSNRLARSGYRVISGDDQIEQKLSPELNLAGHRGIAGVAAWMGWPDSASYREREKKYLRCEIEVMKEILRELEAAGDEKIVVDSTGSVVYTGDETCRRLQQLATVIYLEASPTEQATLIERYLRDPKPVLWGEHFAAGASETPRETAARCYPQLIEHRRKFYEQYAHLILPIATLGNQNLSSNDFINIIRDKARTAR
jgi:shikimate kinase